MLLFGPPSCGKTLIARQIGNILNPREPKIEPAIQVLKTIVVFKGLFYFAQNPMDRAIGDSSPPNLPSKAKSSIRLDGLFFIGIR